MVSAEVDVEVGVVLAEVQDVEVGVVSAEVGVV